ncbi:hypothetical protein BJ971_003394 [Actinoplanes digitatis]|uniref:Uncharacterized protein n=1 Tax=Actinoplanes digitatis TaxID=1868 RepID=A0A7W7HXY0_9ACTN|nr:hypothetical protein [Actinoplanes digitatis]
MRTGTGRGGPAPMCRGLIPAPDVARQCGCPCRRRRRAVARGPGERQVPFPWARWVSC